MCNMNMVGTQDTKRCILGTTFSFFSSFELKLCRMVELCILKNPMFFVF